MPNLRIYNTLSGKKESLKPLKSKRVNLFVCGPTVYDFSHIGHARTYVIFDCFAKYLKQLGYQVFYLQNITNIDDKIIIKAKERGVSPKDLAEAFEKDYLKDMALLGITSVKKYARATDYIKQIVSQVNRLMEKGFAYTLENDGIYYDISKFEHYGKLSHRTALQAEDSVSRIDYSTRKKNRGDFCLWKFAENHEGEPVWNVPIGAGRPGWHIEDTAITEKFFGAQYDIHGGARDLIFPHHEAEIAQMEAISGKTPLAKYWMHTGFLTASGQKMSKSLNNGITISDFIKRYSAQQLRFLIAKNLWSSPIDYSESIMIEVKSALEKIEEFLRKLKAVKVKGKSPSIKKTIKKVKEDFYKELADDFNTPKAFAAMFNFIKEMNPRLDANAVSKKDANDIYAFFMEINKIFNIIDIKKIKTTNVPKEVLELVKTREEHRKNAEWQKADETRQEIEKYGFLVQDTPSGPMVKKI